jgi:hypothetical protein
MPSDTPVKKRRTHYDLDRHFELFLEATSRDAATTEKHSCIRKKSFSQSMHHPINIRTEAPPITTTFLANVFRLFFFRKPKHAARFGQ